MVIIIKKRYTRLYRSIYKNEGGIFFNLVDYHNNYFIGDDPDKIIEFYNGFKK